MVEARCAPRPSLGHYLSFQGRHYLQSLPLVWISRRGYCNAKPSHSSSLVFSIRDRERIITSSSLGSSRLRWLHCLAQEPLFTVPLVSSPFLVSPPFSRIAPHRKFISMLFHNPSYVALVLSANVSGGIGSGAPSFNLFET